MSAIPPLLGDKRKSAHEYLAICEAGVDPRYDVGPREGQHREIGDLLHGPNLPSQKQNDPESQKNSSSRSVTNAHD
jgi:hypothetical protein